MQTGWLNLDGTWYYLNTDGSMAKDIWIGTYYVDANGAWVVEGWQNSGYGWWYQRANGTYPANEWEMINGIWYYFDANGYMLANTTTPDGYYVDENGAWIVEGWQNSGYGWWYQRANGTYPHSEWEMINGIWYYFDANGYMLANTTTPDGYYVDENGAWVK